MSKLNKKSTSVKIGKSYNGNLQFVKSSEQQLYELAAMTLIGKHHYYSSHDELITSIEKNISDVVDSGNIDFIANTIVYARTCMNIRSAPILMAVLFAGALRKRGIQYPSLRRVIADVIQRADQIADMYAVALDYFGNKNSIPLAIKRGVADAFNKFDEYQFGKYNTKASVKLRDVLRIVHPKASSEEQGAVFARIINETLTVPYTWETELSRNGQLPDEMRKSNAQLWTELVSSGKLGYMALLRNLRNMLEANMQSDVLQTHVLDVISDPVQVKKSKQLPFRFLSALKATEIIDLNKRLAVKVHRALNGALDASFSNIPHIGNNIWIIVDCSGSMDMGGTLGSPMYTAAAFAAGLVRANANANNVKITMFSDNAFHVDINPEHDVMDNIKYLINKVEGGGTNLAAALELKDTLGFEPDTVVLLSDMQVDSLNRTYGVYGYQREQQHIINISQIFAPDVVKVAVNLAPYSTSPAHNINGWIQLNGWSDKVFDFIAAFRNGSTIVDILGVPYMGVDAIRHLKTATYTILSTNTDDEEE